MIVWKAIEVVLGIVLVALALRDVFDTVVVPGESRGSLRVARRLGPEATVVTLMADSGLKYLGTDVYARRTAS